MESPDSSSIASQALKRKRSPADERGPPPPIPGGCAGAGVTQINYLKRAKGEKLSFIEGDAETFSGVLGVIDEYEGVLQRHESLAANLGAKLVGPLLLKSFEKLFDGPIKIIQPSFAIEQPPTSWLDIVTFARNNPAEFKLTESTPGLMTCRFWTKGGKVEISEDDFRLIMSGGPERMIPTQPIAEDESAELATLNILEVRLAMLIKKADDVARKARQLNYHLKGRKQAVLSRKMAESTPIIGDAGLESRTFLPQPFSAINARPSPSNTDLTNIQKQLQEQFLAGGKRQSTLSRARPKPSQVITESSAHHHNPNSTPSHDVRRMSHTTASSDEGIETQYRVLMAAKIEKLARGDTINPPCDRCRRLGYDCVKHLTACSACTKKHAKCSWKDIKEGELEYVPHLPAVIQQYHGGGNGYINSPIDLHMNPGLRNIQVLPGLALQQPSGRTSPQTARLLSVERTDNLLNDHATLTQIASAAATAGD